MTELERLHIEQMEAWMATQRLVINSCDMKIRHHEEEIAILQQAIELEKKERVFKKQTLEAAAKDLSEYKNSIIT